jgi:hypothetical protein
MPPPRLGEGGLSRVSSAPKAYSVNSNLPQCMVRRLTAREKLVDEESLRQCISLFVEMCLLAMMRYAAYLSFKTPRLCKSHFSNQVSGTPFLTVLSSLLVRCRPRWENLILIVTLAYAATGS